ncbi:MAG: DUF748 domain-containing protein [Burkholderiales bacterium]
MVVWLKRLAWGVGVVAALWLVTWLGVPALVKWQAPPKLSEALGRSVTLGNVGFKPWAMSVTLDELAIAGAAPGDPPLLKVRHVFADLSLSSIFRRAPVIEALEIDAPQIHLARTREGHYDIDDLIARLAPKPDAQPSEPGRFALYNLQVRDAQLSFDDRPVKRTHKIEALQLALPFLSNLPADIEVKVEPHLAFKLNGAAFDSGAQATPFAQTHAGVLKLSMVDLDLLPYLGYVPESVPVRVKQGSVSADLSVRFAVPPGGSPSVSVQGTAGAKNLAFTDTAGAPLLGWQQLRIGLRDVQPLAHKLAFETLRIEGLQLHAARDAAGRINLLALAPPASDAKVAVPLPASAPVTPAAAPGWQATLEAIDLADARVLWNDAAVQPAAAVQLDALNLSAKQIQWPIVKPIAVTLSGALHPQAAGAPAIAEFAAEGPVTDHDAQLKLALKSLSLAGLAPYLAQALVPTLEGQLAAQAHVDWSGTAEAPRLKLVIDSATLEALRLREGSGKSAQDAVAFKQLALANIEVDLLARSAVVGSIKLVQPSAVVARDAEGRLNVQRWAAAQPHATPAAPPPAHAASSPGAWRVQVKDLLVEGGQLRFTDLKTSRTHEPVRVEVGSLRVALQGLEWHGDKATLPANLQLSARVGAPTRAREKARALTGVLDYKGRVGAVPLLASGKLRVERFPVQLFAPYFADHVQLSLLSAEAGYKGDVALRELAAGLDVSAAGDVLLGAVHIATLPDASAPASANNTDELLSWESFALKGVKFVMKPKLRPQLEIAEAALSDFYSRLVITEQGRFNLQDVAGAPGAAASAPPAEAAASAPAAAEPAASAARAPAADTAPLPIDIKVGVTKLINGRVDFSDHFVRPNYSAALTELNGQLGAFSSGSRDMATLELKGRAAGTALLDISGQLNPTAKPLALDIKAKATDLELAPLSPYAGKYAGYAIERGKLSMDVAYKIDPDGKLDARNQVVLNQLTFGDKIESKDATKLPVLLAVALLKDRNGVIDINLPVSGSVNDPKFSVGGIIIKVILNLLVKALTSPFALLSGGGSDDLSVVEFQPGTALITPAGTGAIDKVAKALADRPALKMTVTGASDPVGERDAFQHAAIESRLVAEQRREGLRAGTPASAASAPAVLVPAERTRLLTRLYKDTDIPNKPRNAVGFAKEIPPSEMEALLKTRTPVTDDAMRELALQRGLAVRDALIAKGLANERLFLAAPKLRVAAEDATAWTPRVQLTLSAN